ncbi:MAG: hypothetical protein ACHP8B_03700 [Terriglobales bacterium]
MDDGGILDKVKNPPINIKLLFDYLPSEKYYGGQYPVQNAPGRKTNFHNRLSRYRASLTNYFGELIDVKENEHARQ